MTTITTAPPAARTASECEPLELLMMVREVAEASGAPNVQRISTRAWDVARALSERHVDAPAARRIAEALGLPWPKVLDIAFKPAAGRSIALGHALNEREGDWLTFEYSDYVLQLVAHRLRLPTLTPGQYRSERRSMLARHRGSLRLPSEHQVEALYGTWDRALSHASLRARQGRGGQLARVRPASIVDVLERCFALHGIEPTSTEVETFARANGIRFPRRAKPWPEYVAEWKAGRQAQGLPVPKRPPPKAQRPDYSQDVGAALPGERRQKRRWETDELFEWVARYLAQLGGRPSSQRSYDDWAREQDGAPWSGAFEGHGGWNAVRRAAQQRMRER